MGLFDFFTGQRRSPEEKPAELPKRDVHSVEVDALSVHTAHLSPETEEVLVIVTTTPDALELIRAVHHPLRLTSGDARPVIFAPSKKSAAPVVDPRHGWIIPVTAATAEELRSLPPGPGEHELTTLHLALVIE
ncbi:hypothetical protein [Corynebacterium aquatimens]|uniref:Uncharacterized protein n=1 Tax=Corynebacterium aquatimens TaxID=1190508 RepID=A0A931DTK1_9CORY|nr:hypothetical protein [Corynebacterium aquatimens]MBG6121179.1 hypothetical protein [Corynebacterium aquatimens]WJY66267.1 hypothetical protein CAQUA_07865 [Corynebacterium aquatimens]